ncbi:MAG: M23 family metallopeptidase [Synergistaceae bacterium]|jgi:murein DD-endopeptidase MepM/ murein hydrolase activator NlpD|nr:M23 family metallopeptidase [Synergistaceae bacterium]
MLNASGGVLYANIDSPQGALDVAGILPGRYGFMETVSSVKALASLMKQSIEVNEILSQQASLAVPESGAETALKIASAVPRFSGPSGQSISQLMSSRNLLWPVSGYIYSAFGAKRGKNRSHGAVDMVIKKGTPIAAAADGVVIVAAEGGKNFKGYGKTVIIDHGNGVHTLYAHCNSLLVKMGQRVKRGDFIATVGRTGRATTDHVHFEVRMAGKKVDPLLYLPSRPELVKAKNWHSKNS